jgi:hypothetical protein
MADEFLEHLQRVLPRLSRCILRCPACTASAAAGTVTATRHETPLYHHPSLLSIDTSCKSSVSANRFLVVPQLYHWLLTDFQSFLYSLETRGVALGPILQHCDCPMVERLSAYND